MCGPLGVLSGTLEYRRLSRTGVLVDDVLDWRGFLAAAATLLCSLLLRLITTLDAGELLGVSTADDASVRADSTVETESRSLRDAVNSSKMASMSLMTLSRSTNFWRTSCWILRISPFTVDRCFISMSMSSRTRFMEGG